MGASSFFLPSFDCHLSGFAYRQLTGLSASRLSLREGNQCPNTSVPLLDVGRWVDIRD